MWRLRFFFTLQPLKFFYEAILSPTMKFILFVFVLSFSIGLNGQPKVNIHAHNDYAQAVPFWNALAAGCASIEADLILKNDTLYVAHERATIQPKRTFETLYLTPIQQSLELGFVKQPFALLIDLKTEAKPTLAQVIKSIEQYPLLIEASEKGTLTFVISGNRPKPRDYHQYPAFIKFDYQSVKPIDDKAILEKVTMVSHSFRSFASWNGKDQLPAPAASRLREVITKAHAMGKPIRFWATPDTDTSWRTLHQMGVDYINTDKVDECTLFFNSARKGVDSH